MVAATVVLISATVSAVSDSDLCLLQPVDQCQGNQFGELGNTDADTDGKPFWFEGDVDNAPSGGGDAVLQYKDSSSTSFSDTATTDFTGEMGPDNNVFWQVSDSFSLNEQDSNTITAAGEEQTFDVFDGGIDADNNEVTFEVNGVNYVSRQPGFSQLQNDFYFMVKEVTQDDASQQISDGEFYNFTIDGNSHSIYLNSVVDSNTISYKVDEGGLENDDEGYQFNLDGKTVEISNVISLGGGDGTATFTVYENGPESVTFEAYEQITAPEDYNEYRIKWVESGSPVAYSDSLFFSVDLGNNLPADRQVTVNDQAVNQPRTLTGVTPNSNINLTTFQDDELDPMNVTLVTSNGTELYTYSTGSDYGAFRSIYDDVSDRLLSVFRTGGNDTFVFPTGNSFFLSEQGTTYSFHFEIMDKAEAGNPVRTTKSYTVETSGTATNVAPNLTVEVFTASQGYVAPENVPFGASSNAIRVNVDDPDNQYHSANLSFRNVHDGFTVTNGSYDRSIGDNLYWDYNTSDIDGNSNNSVLSDSGLWRINVSVSDGTNVKEKSLNFSYPFTDPKIDVDTDGGVVTRYTTFQPDVIVWCPQYECINEDESINSYLDPQPVFGGVFS